MNYGFELCIMIFFTENAGMQNAGIFSTVFITSLLHHFITSSPFHLVSKIPEVLLFIKLQILEDRGFDID